MKPVAIKTDLFVERGGGSGKDSLAQAVRKEWKLEMLGWLVKGPHTL